MSAWSKNCRKFLGIVTIAVQKIYQQSPKFVMLIVLNNQMEQIQVKTNLILVGKFIT